MVTVVFSLLTIAKQMAKVDFVKADVDIAGVSPDFTLDYKSKSKIFTGSSCALKKNKLGGWILTVKLAKGNYAAAWQDDGFTDENHRHQNGQPGRQRSNLYRR